MQYIQSQRDDAEPQHHRCSLTVQWTAMVMKMIFYYGTEGDKTSLPSVRHTQAFLLRNPRKTVVLPGDYLELQSFQHVE